MTSLARHHDAADVLSGGPETTPPHHIYPAIDLVHLSHHSLGDGALEHQLLELFQVQSRQIVQMLHLSVARKRDKSRIIHNLAQTLKGSALVVGARRVADAAGALEAATATGAGQVPFLAQLTAIDHAVNEAGRVVAEILAD